MAEKDLKLNSLSRYSKQSPRLILEEHSHCEVPAGCGGVVLRWLNLDNGIPCTMWLHTSAEASEFLIDGEHPASSRPLLNFGNHTISIRLDTFDPNHGLVMFAGIYDRKDKIHINLSRLKEKEVQILSLSDGSWKYTAIEPIDYSWQHPDFDDSTWIPMSEKSFQEPDEKDRAIYKIRRLEEFGAKGLGVNSPAETIWIRKVFSLVKSNI